MTINLKDFTKSIKKGIEGAVESGKNYSSALGTKKVQNKMIQGYISNKPTNLSPEKKSIRNVIAKQEQMDKELRSKISKKNPSLLK